MADDQAEFRRLIAPVLSELHLELSGQQLALLGRHYSALRRWNRAINLTGIRCPEEIVRRHFGESLFVSKFLADSGGAVDVGSGAGFPGLPIAVVKPELQVTLVESVGKKAAFLKEATRDLPNVRVLCARIETVEGHFDWATVRGVSPPSVLPAISKIADRVALLVGREARIALTEDSCFHWSAFHPLPWSDKTELVIGERRR